MIHPLDIVVLEDDADDVLLLKRAFVENGFDEPAKIFSDAGEAIRFLTEAHAGLEQMPALIITDLKMAGGDGFALLGWLSEQAHYSVPVVIFTGSALSADVRKAYLLGAGAYIRKPQTTEERRQIVRALVRFWQFCEKPLPPEMPASELVSIEAPAMQALASQ
jgi:CheY-like chemotaxis protein